VPTLTPAERESLVPYVTNLDRAVFALRNLPEVVKGALFSRYSRSEKDLRRILLDEFLTDGSLGASITTIGPQGPGPSVAAAESFFQRVLLAYGDDSVAELAGAHLAVENASLLAAKAIEDSRIGISPLEKSTRYVRFDRLDGQGQYAYYREPALPQEIYGKAMDSLFSTYSDLIAKVTDRVRSKYPQGLSETERAWHSATRARALDLCRGLLPAGTLTNIGLYGNGRSFEYLLIKLSANELPECRRLAREIHRELSDVIGVFVRRAFDDAYGGQAVKQLETSRKALQSLAPVPSHTKTSSRPSVTLVDFDKNAPSKVAAAALFPYSNARLEELLHAIDPADVTRALSGIRTNRRQRLPRAFENASYTFEIVSNFGAYRDMQRHRILTQERQLLMTDLGYDVPGDLIDFGFAEEFQAAIEDAASAHQILNKAVGPALAQYAVPLAYRLRWYLHLNLRELYHICELRTGPQGHPDYRWMAQEMFRLARNVHPELLGLADFVDLGPGDELERRASERRHDERLKDV
jgi:thymidylate synthase ThyX